MQQQQQNEKESTQSLSNTLLSIPTKEHEFSPLSASNVLLLPSTYTQEQHGLSAALQQDMPEQLTSQESNLAHSDLNINKLSEKVVTNVTITSDNNNNNNNGNNNNNNNNNNIEFIEVKRLAKKPDNITRYCIIMAATSAVMFCTYSLVINVTELFFHLDIGCGVNAILGSAFVFLHRCGIYIFYIYRIYLTFRNSVFEFQTTTIILYFFM
ncbi:hypothetical protein RFI_39065, partial [Reticulomyxa filosa]